MRSLSTLATLLLGLAVVFWAPAAKADCPHNNDDTHQHCGGGAPATSNEFRFIGFTDTDDVNHTIASDQGMILMHALCQDDFGPNSRMCTSEEFWLSPNAEAPAAQSSWFLTDGVTGGNQHTCNAWTSTTDGIFGLVVTTDGKTGKGGCDVAHPVTCCRQIQ